MSHKAYISETPSTPAQIVIDPQLKGRIEKAVENIYKNNPNLLRSVEYIYALHSGVLGEWRSSEPTAIYINLDLIEQQVEKAVQQGVSADQANTDAIKQAIEQAVQEQTEATVVHETEHSRTQGKGGEGVAESAEQQYLQMRSTLLEQKKKINVRLAATNQLQWFNQFAVLLHKQAIQDNRQLLFKIKDNLGEMYDK